ncbi:MAG TPA: hypothetical protein VIC34_12415 [Croceibacterium sp.]
MPSNNRFVRWIVTLAACIVLPGAGPAHAEVAACRKEVSVSEEDLAQAKQEKSMRIARVRSYLAARSAATKGDRDAALAALQQLDQQGADILPGPQDPLARYFDDPGFAAVLDRLRQRFAPTANGRLVAESERPPVAAESIAYEPSTRRFFLSNWYDNAIYTLTLDGHLASYLTLPELTPNGVKVDAARHRLWFVATDAFRDGAAAPRSRLWSVDLRTGVESTFEAAGAKGFNDLAIAPNGDVYVTDTPGNALYVLAAGAHELRRFLPDETFQQPNGIAVGDNGRHLFVAQGLDLLRIDLQGHDVAAVQLPSALETLGTDGLMFRNGKLYAIQNLMTPGTFVEVTLDRDRAKAVAYRILDRGHPLFDLPTAVTSGQGRVYVIAGTQLYRYGHDKAPMANELKPLRLLAYDACD